MPFYRETFIPLSLGLHCPSQQCLSLQLRSLQCVMEIFCDHRADICMWDFLEDGMGHVIMNSSPGGEFGCEMLPSSPICDNIWSVEALEAVSSLPSASCRRQHPLALSSQHRLQVFNAFFCRPSLVSFFAILRRRKHKQTSCCSIPSPTISFYEHHRFEHRFVSVHWTKMRDVIHFFFKNRHCIVLSDFIISIWFYSLKIVQDHKWSEDLSSFNCAFGQLLQRSNKRKLWGLFQRS